MSEPRTVVIATPCGDQVAAGYAMDLAKLVGFAAAQPELRVVLMQNRGSILPEQRLTLAKAAVNLGASHLLWIDSDMRFPKDALQRLLAHEKPIVAANYTTRRPPLIPTAHDRAQGYLFTTEESTGLAEVSRAGMGLMLVETRVFQALAQPWFTLGYNAQDDGFVGEDVYFCLKAKQAGFPTLIDQDLSRHVKHIGELEVTAEHACLTRAAVLKREQESQLEEQHRA